MEKLKMQSSNLIDANIEKMVKIFPNCVCEGKVDFDILRQELSSVLVEGGDERYRLDWVGKRQAILTANSPIAKTLRPCREESVNFDTTENLYIEGDNLDVLKLLHETYLSRIKMIYIDPPYNTGNDFVYNDDFAGTASEYIKKSRQVDTQGNRMTVNKETSGRYHSDWLSMMYMRLKLARDFLTEDGVIFISIDDNEQANLIKICDEIFGEANFISKFTHAAGRKNDSKFVSVSHEYIICYVKNFAFLKESKTEWRERKQGLDEIYKEFERLSKKHSNDYLKISSELKDWFKSLPKTHAAKDHAHYNCVDKRGIYFPADISWPGGGGPKYDILHPITHKPVKVPSRGWMFSRPERMQEIVDDDRVHFGVDENAVPCIKTYLKDREYSAPYSVFYQDGRASTKRLREIFGADVFENPKDEEIIAKFIEFSLTGNDSIIMDFFSGSATTAHAVMAMNAKDAGNRKFMLVQMSEDTPKDSNARKAGYNKITEIGKERIRRVGKRLIDDNQMIPPNLDIGFRVLKLSDTNMREVYYNPEQYNQSMILDLDITIKADRTPEDVLFQVMLDKGISLSSKIEKRTTANGEQTYYIVGNTGVGQIDLICCLDQKMNARTVEEITKLYAECVVFLDSGITSDAMRTNIQQLFATYSPKTKVEVL
ncbi:MAG: site-specific DNA-methyltransferase [Christensenellaceae bacterium]|jgi:adenine-specific DNA-methyltransferase|nr:site-specific DNA-methyltransferase [Christensenellaceae bacterium]